MTRKDKIKKIADYYGAYAQMRQCMEECAELIVALNKYLQWMDEQHYDKDICIPSIVYESAVDSEIADVKIMLKQFEHFFGNKVIVKRYMDEKLDRQLDRIKNEDNDS